MWTNVRKNSPIPPCIPHDLTACIIYGIKIIDSVDEIISKKTSHKEIKFFLYDRVILHRHAFDLIDWKLFENKTTRVTHLFHIWVVKFVYGFCGTNDIIYKYEELPDTGCPCCNFP